MLRSREALGYLFGLVGVIIFAGTLPATRIAVAELDPWFVTFGRAAGAGLCAVVVLLALRRPFPGLRRCGRLLVCAAMLVLGFPGFMGMAMTTVPAGHGGVVLGILPLATAALGAWVQGERATPAFWLLSATGAAVVIGFSLRSGAGHIAAGDLLLLLAALCAALGYVLSAELTRDMPGWEVISWVCLLSLPLTLPLAWLCRPADFSAVSPAAWAAFGYAALFSQFIGFFAWNAGLAMGGIARISQIQLLQTFFTVAFAALINGERIGAETVLVAGVVVGILVLTGRLRRRAA